MGGRWARNDKLPFTWGSSWYGTFLRIHRPLHHPYWWWRKVRDGRHLNNQWLALAWLLVQYEWCGSDALLRFWWCELNPQSYHGMRPPNFLLSWADHGFNFMGFSNASVGDWGLPCYTQCSLTMSGKRINDVPLGTWNTDTKAKHI